MFTSWCHLTPLNEKLKNWALLLVCSSCWTFHKGSFRIGTSEKETMKQKCREERREKGEEFVPSINIKLSISQLQAHEKETSWLLPSNSNLTNPPQNTQRQGKKGFFYCSFMKSDPQQSSENSLSFWTHMQTGINFFFLFLPYQMNNIYEQYHVCVCWGKQNTHKHKLMNNAVISFFTFNTALGQLLNNQSDLVQLWFDMCQCFLSSPPPPWATGPKQSEIFSVFNIFLAEHENLKWFIKSRRSSNLVVENQRRHTRLSESTGTFCTCWKAEQAHRQLFYFLWFLRSREVGSLEY